MRDYEIETSNRIERLKQRLSGEFKGQAVCLICAPYKGENEGLRRRSIKRTDRYKSRRKGDDMRSVRNSHGDI